MELLLIGIGGGLGACCRYLVSKLISKMHNFSIPIETLIINIFGSFLLGICTKLVQPHWEILLIQTGFMGGFTTFSTYIVESFNLKKDGNFFESLLYMISSVVLGIISYAIGYFI